MKTSKKVITVCQGCFKLKKFGEFISIPDNVLMEIADDTQRPEENKLIEMIKDTCPDCETRRLNVYRSEPIDRG